MRVYNFRFVNDWTHICECLLVDVRVCLKTKLCIQNWSVFLQTPCVVGT